MRSKGALVCMSLATLGFGAAARAEVLENTYVIAGGGIELTLHGGKLADAGVTIADAGASSVEQHTAAFAVESTEATLVTGHDGELAAISGEALRATGSLVLTGPDGQSVTVSELEVHYVAGGPNSSYLSDANGELLFHLFEMHALLQEGEGTVSFESALMPSQGLAARLGAPELFGRMVGAARLLAGLELQQSIFLDDSGEVVGGVLPPSSNVAGSVGPDIIVGDMPDIDQQGRSGSVGSGTVGLAVATTSCNKGDVPVNWFALPNVDHPMIPQNLYRLKTVDGSQRFEHIGQGWMKHGFAALQQNACNFGCTPSGTSTKLGVGCSDPYCAFLNGSQCGLGPRAAVHPFTGVIPGGDSLGSCGFGTLNYPARNHTGHSHDGISHRVQVLDVDLMPSLNSGARYFSETQYISPHEFTAANGNQYNNVSHREWSIIDQGGGNFEFDDVAPTVREEPAINAWPNASQTMLDPYPLVDGRAFLVWEVTDLGDGTFHYEYALYNMNMDASMGSLSIPVPDGVTISNIGFHAVLNHPEEANTPTYSNDPWTSVVENGAITWSTTPFAVDENANAVRFGTLYNFRFDADTGPTDVTATVGLFKTGDTVLAATQGPSGPLAVVSSEPPDGAIDARQPSDPDGSNPDGWSSVQITFSGSVAGLEPGDFSTSELGGDGIAPGVASVTEVDTDTVEVTLTGAIEPGAWTTVTHVASGTGVQLGYLPADVDGNATSVAQDLLVLIDVINGVTSRPDYATDVDRSGLTGASDVLREIDLLNGAGVYDAWLGVSLP